MIHIKKHTAAVALLVIGTMIIPTLSMADAKKGHRVYKKKLQRKCKFAGSIFARKHTQEEWEKINDEGLFKAETKKICPQIDLDKLNERQWKDMYEFTHKYGIGGEIPNGCDPK